MFGWGYVKDFCISLFLKKQKERVTLFYFAECLRIISENTAKMTGGAYVQMKLQEILEPTPTETRTPEDIINGIREKLKK